MRIVVSLFVVVCCGVRWWSGTHQACDQVIMIGCEGEDYQNITPYKADTADTAQTNHHKPANVFRLTRPKKCEK